MELDEQLIREACAYVKVGNFPIQALVSCGVPEPDAARWLAVGKSHQQEGCRPDADLQVALVAACDIAAADWERGQIAQIQSSHGQEWRKYVAMLEKRFPDRYAPKPGPSSRRGESRSLEDILDEVASEQKDKA